MRRRSGHVLHVNFRSRTFQFLGDEASHVAFAAVTLLSYIVVALGVCSQYRRCTEVKSQSKFVLNCLGLVGEETELRGSHVLVR